MKLPERYTVSIGGSSQYFLRTTDGKQPSVSLVGEGILMQTADYVRDIKALEAERVALRHRVAQYIRDARGFRRAGAAALALAQSNERCLDVLLQVPPPQRDVMEQPRLINLRRYDDLCLDDVDMIDRADAFMDQQATTIERLEAVLKHWMFHHDNAPDDLKALATAALTPKEPTDE